MQVFAAPIRPLSLLHPKGILKLYKHVQTLQAVVSTKGEAARCCCSLSSVHAWLRGIILAQVTVFSTSEKKRAEALKTLGADHFIVSKDEDQMNVSQMLNSH